MHSPSTKINKYLSTFSNFFDKITNKLLKYILVRYISIVAKFMEIVDF